MAALLVVLVVLAGTLFWLGEGRSFTGHYVPAKLRGGAVVSGHPG